MFFLLLALWFVFNGRFTVEVLIVGIVVCLAVYVFICAFMGYSPLKDLKAIKNIFRYLMISPYLNRADEEGLEYLEIPDDRRLLVSVHFYTPYKFTGNSEDMDVNISTWNVEEEYTRTIDAQMEFLKEFIEERKVPVVITEMGATYKGNNDDRIRWIDYVTDGFDELGISYFWWDDNYEEDKKSYGILDRINNRIAYEDIVDALIGDEKAE